MMTFDSSQLVACRRVDTGAVEVYAAGNGTSGQLGFHVPCRDENVHSLTMVRYAMTIQYTAWIPLTILFFNRFPDWLVKTLNKLPQGNTIRLP